MDEENLFLSEEEYLLTEKTTNLVSENLASERIFKLKVLEWLTNGETKVFRSPGEGNYIVRLMNSSLAPNDTLGRMLHTFSSTAYEVADFTYKNLNDYKLPDTHHLDISANYAVKHNYGESVIGVSVYNIYNHMNPSMAYIGIEKDNVVMKCICPFPIMPSLSYTHKF